MMQIIQQIEFLNKRIRDCFADSIGPNNRKKYMLSRGHWGIDWSFSLTADDIIN